MGRVPDAEIERVKTEVSLQRLVEARGIELRRHGADLVGLCPFHDDHEPSLVISPAKNLWHCMGACGAGGSVIDWVMRTDGLSFRHALEVLLDGRAEVGTGGAPRRASVRRLAPPVDAGAPDAELLGQVVAYYHATLTSSPEALAYLTRRRIDHPEAISRFRLGYANRTLGYRLPERNRKDGAELRGRLGRLGILRASGHEHFAGSLVVPVADEAGTVTELYGRKLRDDLRAGTPAVGGALLSFGLVALWFGFLGGKAKPPSTSDQSSPAGGLRWLINTSPYQLRYGARGTLIGLIVLAFGLLLMSIS